MPCEIHLKRIELIFLLADCTNNEQSVLMPISIFINADSYTAYRRLTSKFYAPSWYCLYRNNTAGETVRIGAYQAFLPLLLCSPVPNAANAAVKSGQIVGWKLE